MKSITVPAKVDQLDRVLDFVNVELELFECSMKAQMQVVIAVEEIFVNIANYAYRPLDGEATVCCEVSENPLSVTIQFLDYGAPFNPLNAKEPDIDAPAEEREIGGLGIYMVKKSMDSIDYAYENGKNVLTIKKNAT